MELSVCNDDDADDDNDADDADEMGIYNRNIVVFVFIFVFVGDSMLLVYQRGNIRTGNIVLPVSPLPSPSS